MAGWNQRAGHAIGGIAAVVALLAVVLSPAGPAAAGLPPEITSFSPSTGPTGITVTIDGRRMSAVRSVRFNGVEAQFRVVSTSTIDAVVPPTATTGPITVIKPSGSATSTPSFVVRPNIVLILTDDERFDELSMPTLQSELQDKGTTFQNSFVVDPLCCPSRTTILTGKYSHSTDIYDNRPPHGGFQTFNANGEESSTVATWLHDAGYHTGLVGKYLNGYFPSDASYIPPGWDTWDAATVEHKTEGLYKNYYMSIDGQLQYYGNADADYSTDVLSGYADRFIDSAPVQQPLFLMFTPVAPHLVAPPPQRYRTAFPNLAPLRPPSYNEADVSDKPQYIQNTPPMTSDDIARRDWLRRRQYQSLLAVDDAVKGILDALKATGRLSSTLILFSSDNGLNLGEHRWTDKRVPYEESIRVPLIVRYDPITDNVARTDDHLVLNLDYASTFAAAGGTSAPGSEGANLLPLLAGNSAGWRSDFLIEHANADTGSVPPYCGVRNAQYIYVKYSTGEEELYDLTKDPFELQNRASDPAYAQIRSSMYARMVQLCSPPPPGFTP
jgi:N-acetylglucosamine-6-sulfatase